jgi:hypothetical protein
MHEIVYTEYMYIPAYFKHIIIQNTWRKEKTVDFSNKIYANVIEIQSNVYIIDSDFFLNLVSLYSD